MNTGNGNKTQVAVKLADLPDIDDTRESKVPSANGGSGSGDMLERMDSAQRFQDFLNITSQSKNFTKPSRKPSFSFATGCLLISSATGPN